MAVIDNVPFAEFGSRYYTLIGYAAVVGLFALSLARFTWSWLHSDVRISSALRAQTYKKTLAQLFQQRATIDTTLLYSLYAFVPLASLLFALWGGARLDANIMASLPEASPCS